MSVTSLTKVTKLNLGLLVTQIYLMALEDLKYPAEVVWILEWCFHII